MTNADVRKFRKTQLIESVAVRHKGVISGLTQTHISFHPLMVERSNAFISKSIRPNRGGLATRVASLGPLCTMGCIPCIDFVPFDHQMAVVTGVAFEVKCKPVCGKELEVNTAPAMSG